MDMAVRVAKNGSAMRQIISEEKRRQIVAALKDNPNAKQVAQKIGGVSHTTVGKIAKAAGVALAVAKSGWLSAEQRAQIIGALKANPNATEIAREVGCVNYRTVVRLAEGAGIELTAGKAARGHPRVSPEKHAQIIGALKANPNAKQVARKIGGVSHTKVGKIAKAAGIALAAAESGKRLSAEQRAQIIGVLKADANKTQAARKIGVSRRTVDKIAKAAGITLAAAESGKRLSAKQRAQIIGVLKANPNKTQAARKIGVSRTTVGKIAKAAGITLAPAESGKQLSAEQRAQIIGALKANPNASEVARQIGGVSYAVVWKIAKAAGIDLTRGKAARDHRPNKVSR